MRRDLWAMRSRTFKASRRVRLTTAALAAMALSASPAAAKLPPEPPPEAMAIGPASEPVVVAPVSPIVQAIAADVAAARAESPDDPVTAGLVAFYTERENAPAWTEGTRISTAVP